MAQRFESPRYQLISADLGRARQPREPALDPEALLGVEHHAKTLVAKSHFSTKRALPASSFAERARDNHHASWPR